MTDKPILFSAPMVLALLEGRKTQTRRVLKLPTQGEYTYRGGWEPTTNGGGGVFTFGKNGERIPCPETIGIWNQTTGTYVDAPWQIGDRLWVREAFTQVGEQEWLLYRADGYESECARHGFDKSYPAEKLVKWKSPIFMARAFSRLTLTVTGVKIQRLQDINEEDAIEEGVELDRCCGSPHREGFPSSSCCGQPDMTDPVEEYRILWNNINGPCSWDENPWVIALTFDVHRGNIDEVKP